MNHQIIKDSELDVEALAESKEVLYTESEIELYKKTPWILYQLNEEPFDKNSNFYINAGYKALSTVITFDNTLKSVLKLKPLDKITADDLQFDEKLDAINQLSKAFSLKPIVLNHDKIANSFYECKIRGFHIAEICQSELIEEQLVFKAKALNNNRQKFAGVVRKTSHINSQLTMIKGSYIKYIESGKTSKVPSDIDISLIVGRLDENRYYELIHETFTVNKIEARPILVPSAFIDGYTFFDFNVDRKSIVLHGEELIYTRRSPEKLLRAMGATGLEKLRTLTVNDDEIANLCAGKYSHRKIYTAIKLPEIIYEKFKENGLGHIADEPFPRSLKFKPNLPVYEIKELLAESSIELSYMTQKLSNHIERKNRR